LWNVSYEIPNPDVETDSEIDIPRAIDFEFDKNVSCDDDLASCTGAQALCALRAPSPAKNKEFKLPEPTLSLGKLIRDCARPAAPSYAHRSRDRYRERSVSRARDIIVASKRRDVGLPPAHFRPPACHFKVRVPDLQPLLGRHTRGYRNAGPRMPQPQMQSADRHRADALASANTSWILGSIKVSWCICLCMSRKF